MYVDSTYARVVDGIGTSGFQGAADIDERVVDGTVDTIGKLTVRLGQLIRPGAVGIYPQLRGRSSARRSRDRCLPRMGNVAVIELLASQSASSFPVLNAMIIVPVIGALVVVLLPNSRPEMMRPIGAIFASIAAAMSLYMMAQFSSHDAGFQFESIQSWIPALGINWHVGVDGISLWLVVLTGLITPIVLLAVDPTP